MCLFALLWQVACCTAVELGDSSSSSLGCQHIGASSLIVNRTIGVSLTASRAMAGRLRSQNC
jgi:hypothetical protein